MIRPILAASLLVLLAACGSGGGEAPPAAPAAPIVDLGTVAPNVVTNTSFEVTNTSGAEAQVGSAFNSGPFALVEAQFPIILAAGASAQVQVTFTPTGPGDYDETIGAQLTTSGGAAPVRANFLAEVETPSMGVQTLNVAFGDVLPATTADRTVTVSNTSAVTTLAVNGGTFPDAAFAFTGAFPVQVPPGQTRDLTLRYAPTGPGVFDTTVGVVTELGASNVGVTATSGGQTIVDFGTQTLDGKGDTPELTFDVPADAISFTVEGRSSSGSVGLRVLEGPGPRVYENASGTGSYIWRVNGGLHLSQVPNTDRTEVQLVPGGGTYKLKLYRFSGNPTTIDVRVIIERRPAQGTDVIGTLDLNVFLANAITPTAATAANDTTLQTVLTTVDNILSQEGLRLGDIDYYDISNTAYDDVTDTEFGPMLATSSVASEVRLNLFFVREAIGGGILGVAAMLGGPAINGTTQSGVMSLYSTNSPSFIGLVAAHEIGHFVGLAHTVERSGSHDDITDTAQCPATGSNATCPTAGGGYLMHWQAVGGSTITVGQGLVIRGHPLVGPRLVAPPPFTSAQRKPQAPFIQVDPTVPQNWCGTCRSCNNIKGK